MHPLKRLLEVPGGPSSLSDAELLSLLVDITQPAVDSLEGILREVGGMRVLLTATAPELFSLGFSPRATGRILAAVELTCRAQRAKADRTSIRTPADIHALLLPGMALLDQESLVVLCLNKRHQLLHVSVVSLGGASLVIVDPAIVYRLALRQGASAIIVAHNHPSGDPSPSTQDVEATLRLAEVGKTLGIPLLDHIIVAREGFTSLAGIAHLSGLMPLQMLLAS